MKVREIMTTPVTTIEQSDSIAFAEQLMTVERVRHLPVVDGDTLVGLLSQRDVLAASISSLKSPSTEEDLDAKTRARASDIMRGSVETIGPDEDAAHAADVILANKLGCLPVVDERHRLIGIVTETDFVILARDALRLGKVMPKSPVVLASASKKAAPKKAAAKQPPAKKAAPKKSAAKKPTAKKSAAKKPTKKPAAKKTRRA